MADTRTDTSRAATRGPATDEPRESRVALQPPVDIFENADGITLIADMPGVSKERLEIHVDKDSLTVEGEASIDMPDGMEAIYADVRATRYRRSFSLSGELETAAIDASLKDGVLRITIPKRSEIRPRKIEVRAG